MALSNERDKALADAEDAPRVMIGGFNIADDGQHGIAGAQMILMKPA